jgi:hypothetical protein
MSETHIPTPAIPTGAPGLPGPLPAASALNIANLDQVGDALMAQGLTTEQEIHGHLDAIDRGLRLALGPLLSTWGRRPPQA